MHNIINPEGITNINNIGKSKPTVKLIETAKMGAQMEEIINILFQII